MKFAASVTFYDGEKEYVLTNKKTYVELKVGENLIKGITHQIDVNETNTMSIIDGEDWTEIFINEVTEILKVENR